MADTNEPKLIIDSDWKSQAQAEKECLSQGRKPAAAPSKGASEAKAEGVPQKVGFKDILSLLISQALAYMGAYPDPRTGQAMVSLELAKLHIDMLAVLEEKTKGNLEEAEANLLTRALQELRLEYVEIAGAVEKAVAEGRISRGPGGGMGAGMGGGMGAGAAPGVSGPKLNFPPDLRTPGA